MQPTKEEIKLTPQTVEALEKLERKECDKCGGLKTISTPPRSDPTGNFEAGMVTDTMPCLACNGTGKVGGWKWQPKVGEWAYINNEGDKNIPHLVVDYANFGTQVCLQIKYRAWFAKEELTPILHWETIEKILGGMGYGVEVNYISELPQYYEYKGCTEGDKYFCRLERIPLQISFPRPGTKVIYSFGKKRQTAMMKAVVEFGKELSL